MPGGAAAGAGGAGLRAGVRVSPQDAVPPEEASLVEERSRKGPARPAAQAECQPWPPPQSSPRPHNPPWTELCQAPQPRLPRKATASPDCLQTRSPRRESLLRHRLTLQPRAPPDPPNPFHRGKSLLLQWARGGQRGTGAPLRHPTSLLHFPRLSLLPVPFQGRAAPARRCPSQPLSGRTARCGSACTCSRSSAAAARPLVAIWGGSAKAREDSGASFQTWKFVCFTLRGNFCSRKPAARS